MAPLVRAIAVLTVLVAAAWLLLWQSGETPLRNVSQPATPAPTSTPTAAPAEPAPMEREPAPPPTAIPGSLEAGPPQDANRPAAAAVRLKGRCVADEDGTPLADCLVTVRASCEDRVHTDVDGVFVVDFVPSPSGSVKVEITATGRVPREGELLLAGNEHLGTIRIPRGFVISGRVVELDGTGVPGHNVLVFGVDVALRPGQVSQAVASAACADDGAFTLDMALPAGAWQAHLFAGPRRRQRGDGAFRVHPITGAAPLVLTVEPALEIRGIVVDDTGQPVANVDLRTEQGGAAASSQHDGSFELVPTQPVAGSTHILLREPAEWPAGLVPPGPPTVAWGQHEVRIVLRRGPSLTVEAVDEGGAPVTEFSVLFVPTGDHAGINISREDGRHEGGRIDLPTMRQGGHLLRVLPYAADLLATEPRLVQVTGAQLPVQRVVLERLGASAVVVEGDEGQGVPDADVDLVRVGWSRDDARQGHQDPHRSLLWYGDRRSAELVAAARTDADGACSLLAPRDCSGFLLRVHRAGYVPGFAFDPRLSTTDALRIRLARGGTLAGSVALHGQSRELVRIGILQSDGRPADTGQWGGVPLDSAREFLVPVLPVGDYLVSVLRQVEARSPGESQVRYVPTDATSQRVHIAAGETTTVQLDAPPIAMGSLTGRLLVPAGTASVRVVHLVLVDGEGAMRGEFPLGADDSFEADDLLPGRYRLAVGGGPMPAQLRNVIEIDAGANQPRDFPCTPRKLTLRLRTATGEPNRVRVEVRCGWLRNVFGPRSELVLDPAPELPVQVRQEGAPDWSEPVTMPDDRAEHTAEVVVPTRR